MSVLELISKLRACNVVPRLVEGKLKLAGNTSVLSPEFLTELKENKQVLIDFLLDQQSGKDETIEPITKRESYPMSSAQQRIWVLSQFEGGSEAYNIADAFYLKGKLNIPLFDKAFQISIGRHESLRTYFVEIDGVPVQKIVDSMPFEILTEGIQGISKMELKEVIKRFSSERFELNQLPLFRVKMLHLSKEEHIMLFNIHHIIGDGWSLGVLLQEVMGNYKNLCLDQPADNQPLNIQFKDYEAWLTRKISGKFGEEARAFWSSKKLDSIDPIQLPTDFQRSDKNSFSGASQRFSLDDRFYQLIESLAQKHQATTFNFYRSILSIVLHKWTNQTQLCIGTPVAGRSNGQLSNQIGMYVNTLPLISNYAGQLSFSEYIQQISKDSFSTFRFQDYPLDLIVEENNIAREAGRNPVFDVMMVLQNNAVSDGSIDRINQHGFTFNGIDDFFGEKDTGSDDTTAKFDLSFYFSSDTLAENFLGIEYKTSLFKKSTIQALYKMIEFVIYQIAENDDVLLKDISVVNEAEKNKILTELNHPIVEHQESNILDIVWKNFDSFSHKLAVSDNEKEISYSELNTQSDGIGQLLILNQSEKVGLFLSRSSHIVSAVLGIWKAGKTYVPIDITYPPGRIQYIIEDSEVEVVLVDSKSEALIPESFQGTCINLDEVEFPDNKIALKPTSNKDDVAYLIYTSGSTGQPKGVEITHRNVIAFIKWCQDEFASTPYEVMFAGTSYCFDLSVFEMLFPLSQGKRLRMLESGISIIDFILKEKNIFVNTVPSVVRSLLDQRIKWDNVVALNMAGEPVPKIFKDQLDFQKMEVRNLYGPSEDTTYSTVYRFSNDELNYIPIGVPVGDTHLYILDDDLNILPIGVEGEICLSGESIARGYFNKPELTNEKFIDNPFVQGKRIYRTGDIGQWTADGVVAFTGRKDDQVKVRGFRIELGEIQYQLDCIDQIEQAVAIVKEVNGEKAIIAYYTPKVTVTVDSIKEVLAENLPAYMIPSYFVEMDKIPMNSNGKADKKQLPEPESGAFREIIEPKTETQRRLLTLWEASLNTTGFGIESNFFELGGHSLKATKLRGLILTEFQKEITLNELFDEPNIPKMAELIDSKSIYVEKKIERIQLDHSELIPLSYAQERLWVLTKFENASKAYHMPAAFKLTGNFDGKILESALINVIDRHESLRTAFRERNGIPFQYIFSSEEMDFKMKNIQLDADTKLEEYLQNSWSEPFDMENGPLFRCTLIQSGIDLILSFNMHHIISDGWSVGVLIQDVMKSYAQLSRGESGKLGDLDFQYKDFSSWQQKELAGTKLQEQLNYWKDQVFAKDIQPLELPYDYLRPEIKTYNGASEIRVFPKSLSETIAKQSAELGVSIYMTLMANASILFKKLSNQSDIVIGTPVSGRDSRQLQSQIGFYVNTLPIRIYPNGNLTYRELLQEVRGNLLSAFDYQHFPFEMLVDEVQPRRDTSRSPLFDVMLVMQNFNMFESSTLQLSEEVQFENLDLSSGNTKYDLTFSFSEQENGIRLELDYNTDLFKKSSIERIVNQLECILEQTMSTVNIPVSDITVISKEDQSRLLEKSDFTSVQYDSTQTIVSHFETAVQLNPDKVALKVGDQTWTYQELDEKSGQLAAILVNDYGIKDESFVVLHVHRNEWMLIAILACLKAGAVYIPVDPDYPSSRIQYILEDSQATLILADSHFDTNLADLFEQKTWLDVSGLTYQGEGFRKELDPNQLAYIIYTSGTTGNPKGVLISHQNVSRLLFNENDYFDFTEADSWTLFHSYCFDFSVWEMYGALLKGGTLVMVPKEVAQNSEAFFDFLSDEKITVLNQTPTAFRSLSLTNQEKFRSKSLDVRFVIFGGEALMPSILKEWHQSYPSCKLINMYGITETTVHVTYKEIGKVEIEENKSNIGSPIPTLSCYVLDEDLKPCAPGVIGELCVGGAGVARGYHNKPELTSEKFVFDSIRGEGKLYRSGDFARLLQNGDIEYIGRKDEQVKIRGHRIELAEVEEGLKLLNSVEDAVVLATKNAADEFELIAYYITDTNETEQNIREVLSDVLPSYMIPTQYVKLDQFPITSNGKLDKAALSEITATTKSGVEFVAAENEIQAAIVAIWEEVLGKEKIGIRDNFFDLGGHSLKATRVISKIQEVYQVRIDLGSLFIDPTIESLANHVSALTWITEVDEEDSNGEELII